MAPASRVDHVRAALAPCFQSVVVAANNRPKMKSILRRNRQSRICLALVLAPVGQPLQWPESLLGQLRLKFANPLRARYEVLIALLGELGLGFHDLVERANAGQLI